MAGDGLELVEHQRGRTGLGLDRELTVDVGDHLVGVRRGEAGREREAGPAHLVQLHRRTDANPAEELDDSLASAMTASTGDPGRRSGTSSARLQCTEW